MRQDNKLPPNYYVDARIPAIDNTRQNMKVLYPVCESCPYKYYDNKQRMSLEKITEEKQKHFDGLRKKIMEEMKSKKENFINENAPANIILNSPFKQGDNQYNLTFSTMIGGKNKQSH